MTTHVLGDDAVILKRSDLCYRWTFLEECKAKLPKVIEASW